MAGVAPTNFLDLRDNKPGYASDVFLGYEQAAFQYRDNPEKFAAKNTLSNTVVSPGAETYYTTVGDLDDCFGSGYGQRRQRDGGLYLSRSRRRDGGRQCPGDPARALPPTNNQSMFVSARLAIPTANINSLTVHDRWVKSRWRLWRGQRRHAGSSGGVRGPGQFREHHHVVESHRARATGRHSRCGTKWAHSTAAAWARPTARRLPVESTSAKYYGMTQFAITNFNPTTATVWLHNDLNPANTRVGLQGSFSSRARVFLPRQVRRQHTRFHRRFITDGALPTGTIAFRQRCLHQQHNAHSGGSRRRHQ